MSAVKHHSRGILGVGEAGLLDSYQPPWPEWSDTFINTMQWQARPAKKSIFGSPGGQRSRALSTTEDMEELFEDPAGMVALPVDMPVASWERPHHHLPDTMLVVQPDPLPLDLVTHNKHLLHYKIMRTIMSSISCVAREASLRPFPVECQTEQYAATGGPVWQPWHHVYAFSPAGKGSEHTISYNKHGKYVLRLFYLGKWRRIIVDDFIPVSEAGHVLLPMSQPNNLWLALLSKGLLRIASLSWTSADHCVDFSVVHCLTGWIPTVITCKVSSQYLLWCVCCQLMDNSDGVVHAPGCCPSESRLSCPREEGKEHLPATGSRVIMANVQQSIVKSVIERLSDNDTLDNQLLVSNVRYNSERPSPLWKEYRWKEWAYSHGIISDVTSKPNKNILIFNPLAVPLISKTKKVDGSIENEYWLNFDAFIPLVSHFEVFYKPSYFKYSLRAWSVPEILLSPQTAEDVVSLCKERGAKSKSRSPQRGKSEKSANESVAKTSKFTKKTKSAIQKNIKEKNRLALVEEWPKNHQAPSFFYFLVDSMSCKQVYVCLSAYDPLQPTYAHIVTGQFQWYSATTAPLEFMLTTSATVGHVITLSPGMHAFCIWHQFPEYFSLKFFSNTPFLTGTKMKIQQHLNSDSESYKFYAKEINRCFEQLLNAVQGGAQHGQAYNELMRSLWPPNLTSKLSWPHWRTAHTDLERAFEESLTEMLSELSLIPAEMYNVLQAFQLLFLNPVFGEKILLNFRIDYYKFIQERRVSKRKKDVLLELEMKETLARAGKKKGKSKSPTKTDTSTKTGKAGKQKDDKKGKSKNAYQYLQLRKLLQCKEKSLLLSETNNAISLLKRMMTKVPHLLYLYPFSLEYPHRLCYKDFVAEQHVQEKWVVPVRCVLNTHSTEKVPCSLHVWSPLKKLVLRLIDNDTLQEILLGFVENNVVYLSRNKEGYTVCVYGEAASDVVSWRLRSIGVSDVNLLHVCHGVDCSGNAPPPLQAQQTLSGYYVPNKNNVITRCLLEVLTDTTVLLRLHLNNRSAFCSFTILNQQGSVVETTTGMGHIILESVKLKGIARTSWLEQRSSRHNSVSGIVYRVEVRLLNHSWSLDADQCRAMLYYKEHLPDILLKPRHAHASDQLSKDTVSFSSERSSVSEVDFFEQAEKPTWTITLVADSQKVMPVMLHLDTGLFKQLVELKAEWQSAGTDLVSCQKIREDYLNQESVKQENDWSEEAVFHLLAKKINELTDLYGRRHNSVASAVDLSSGSPKSLCSQVSKVRTQSHTTLHQHSLSLPKSLSLSEALSSARSVQSEENHSSVLVQQAGIHAALEKLRINNMEKLKTIMEETALKRTQLLNEMRIAKEAESKQNKTKSDNSQKKVSLISNPGQDTKNKAPVKYAKILKSAKGKGK